MQQSNSPSFWSDVNALRSSWQVVEPEENSFISEFPETISRAICLRHLELPVKQFIQQGIDSSDAYKIGPDGLASLVRNQEDEDRHDIALSNCFKAMRNFNPKYTLEASSIIQEWLDLDVNPITKTAVLENSVFFIILPIFNKYGFSPLRETSRDISRDERIHVITHRKAAQLLNSPPTKALNALRIKTVDWLTQSMDTEIEAGLKDKYMLSSYNLLTKGISSLDESKTVTGVAFFEKPNNHISKYS